MNWLDIMWIIAGIIVILLGIAMYRTYKARRSDMMEDISIITVIAMVVVVSCLIINLWSYNNAVAIPYEYRALINNVDDMEEYLMRYENTSGEGFGSIGQGLESLEYKQELQQAIKDRNEKHADICAMLNNFWTPYKDIIISGLPPGDYGTGYVLV